MSRQCRPPPIPPPFLRVQLRHLGEGKTRGSRHLHSAGHATGRAACRAACDRPCGVRHWHVEGEGEGRGGGWLTWGDRTSAKDKALGGHEGVESPFACRIANLSEAAESARPAAGHIHGRATRGKHRGYRGTRQVGKKEVKKTALGRGPMAGSGRLGRFKTRPVRPARLGRSRRSRLLRNTNIINSTQLVNSYTTHSHNMYVHDTFFISITFFHP